MTQSKFSLREIKKARSKIAIYNSFLQLIGDNMFHDLLLEDICRKAEISNVTFFKYFRRKEDLLLYYMRIWLTERIIEIHEENMRGLASIRHLFKQVASHWHKTPGIMPSLISFLAEMKMHPCMPELSAEEISLLFPGHEAIGAEPPDMFKLFHRCMVEAREDGELREGFSVEQAVQFLFTVFYGAFLTAQLYGTEDIYEVYETHLQILIQPSTT